MEEFKLWSFLLVKVSIDVGQYYRNTIAGSFTAERIIIFFEKIRFVFKKSYFQNFVPLFSGKKIIRSQEGDCIRMKNFPQKK